MMLALRHTLVFAATSGSPPSSRRQNFRTISMAAKYGFNPLPRSQEKLLKGHKKDSPYIPISEIAVPDTKIVHAINEYVKKELSPETYNHCMRVYFYGISTL